MDNSMQFDYAVHSGFLIHWTGKDIESDVDWYESDKSKTPSETDDYLNRLLDILRYGLWMTEEDDEKISIASSTIKIPQTPKCCFTELKLSEARRHARDYGRLGIGVKRPFMFNRYGRPVAYFGYGAEDARDQFLKACAEDLKDTRLLNFFKPMCSSLSPKTYDLYRESEWRIIFFEELLNEGKIVDPRNPKNEREFNYFNSLNPNDQEKLKYLIPLDGWFSMIIYPSLDVKNRAQQIKNEDPNEISKLIRQEISRIKENTNDQGNKVEGGNRPMEVDLDACRNF